MSCSHERTLDPVWVTHINDWDGEEYSQWEYPNGETQSTLEDIDTHRYKCTQCGEIFYYSQRAKQWYENGQRDSDAI